MNNRGERLDVGGPSPAGLLDEWCGFIEQCEEGYIWSIYEYDNDLDVRRRIQVLADRLPGASASSAEFMLRVGEIDSRLRALFQPAPAQRTEFPEWWRQGVLRYAGREYAEDIRRGYGFDVGIVE